MEFLEPNDVKSKARIIVPVSGGKDSQSCLKLAVNHVGAPNVLGLFCDTRFEHPITYEHVDSLKSLYGVNILTINSGSVEDKILKYKRFPGGGARHCTSELKIRPSKIFYKEYAEFFNCTKGDSFEVWYGVRSDESAQRKKRYLGKIGEERYPPHEFMRNYPQYLYKKFGITFRLPIIDWSREDVMEFLNGEENLLYSMGFDRVGCFPCLASGDKWKEKAFTFDEFGKLQYQKVKSLEESINKSVWTSKGGKSRNCDGNGCSICSI